MAGWLDDNDLAWFIVDLVDVLDTREIEAAYRGGGSAPYPPKMLSTLLFYGYEIAEAIRWHGKLLLESGDRRVGE